MYLQFFLRFQEHLAVPANRKWKGKSSVSHGNVQTGEGSSDSRCVRGIRALQARRRLRFRPSFPVKPNGSAAFKAKSQVSSENGGELTDLSTSAPSPTRKSFGSFLSLRTLNTQNTVTRRAS